MGTVIVDIYYTSNYFCAQAPVLEGCVSTASTLSDMKRNIKEAIEFHVKALLNAYSDIFTKASLSNIPGIN